MSSSSSDIVKLIFIVRAYILRLGRLLNSMINSLLVVMMWCHGDRSNAALRGGGTHHLIVELS